MSVTQKKGRVKVGKTKFIISTESIVATMGLPAEGDIYFKLSIQKEMGDFLYPTGNPTMYHSGYEQDSFPQPWDRVAEKLKRYFTLQ